MEKRPLNEAKKFSVMGSWEDFEVDEDAEKDVDDEWCGIAVHEDNGNRVRVVRRIKTRRSPLWIWNVLDLVARSRNRLISFAFGHPIDKHRKQKNMARIGNQQFRILRCCLPGIERIQRRTKLIPTRCGMPTLRCNLVRGTISTGVCSLSRKRRNSLQGWLGPGSPPFERRSFLSTRPSIFRLKGNEAAESVSTDTTRASNAIAKRDEQARSSRVQSVEKNVQKVPKEGHIAEGKAQEPCWPLRRPWS